MWGGLLIRCCHYYIYIFTSTPQAWLRGWRQWRHWQHRQSCSKIQYTHGPHETRLHRTWWGGTRRAIYAVYRLDGGFSPRTPPKLWQLWPLRRDIYIYIYTVHVYINKYEEYIYIYNHVQGDFFCVKWWFTTGCNAVTYFWANTSDSKLPKVTKHQRHPTTNIILAPNTFGQNGVRPKIRWLLLRTKSMGPVNLTHNHICPPNISQQCPKIE